MTDHGEKTKTGLSRRSFLGRVGVGAVAVGTGNVMDVATAKADRGRGGADGIIRSDRFSRMFRLPAFADPSAKLEAAFLELAKPGGLLDARDPLDKGPILLITDPSLSANNPDNPTHTAGTTFMGQFIDHDITFDIASPLGKPLAPEEATNGRTPSLDLDSLYGAGPVAGFQLYDGADRAKLRIESGGLFEDIPRRADGDAIIGDPRNDEHLIIAGMHAAFLRFHNNAVDLVRAPGMGVPELFTRARRLTTWHYQWLVLHEYLPLIVGQGVVDDILSRGRRFYLPAAGEATIPVEFQGAAYRFGHSMVRPSYRANLAGDKGKPFFALVFDPSQLGKADPDDLRGGVRAPRRFIGWQTFFDFGDGQVKHNKRIDSKLSTPLLDLPRSAIATHDDDTAPRSLPQRTLLRHLTWQLPSGQQIAGAMGVPALSPSDLGEYADFGVGLERSTPLFLYVLKEAEIMEDGLRLGPMGGRLVAEVLIGLLQTDPTSYLSVQPGWQPTLPGGAGFRMTDFLTFAGVDPKSRGQ